MSINVARKRSFLDGMNKIGTILTETSKKFNDIIDNSSRMNKINPNAIPIPIPNNSNNHNHNPNHNHNQSDGCITSPHMSGYDNSTNKIISCNYSSDTKMCLSLSGRRLDVSGSGRGSRCQDLDMANMMEEERHNERTSRNNINEEGGKDEEGDWDDKNTIL